MCLFGCTIFSFEPGVFHPHTFVALIVLISEGHARTHTHMLPLFTLSNKPCNTIVFHCRVSAHVLPLYSQTECIHSDQQQRHI